jgi:hypothetical protein
MPLPFNLPVGTVAVYGSGAADFPNPFSIAMPADYRYGTVYHIWSGGGAYMATNDVVMFPESSVVSRFILSSDNNTYTVVPARLATKQYVAP